MSSKTLRWFLLGMVLTVLSLVIVILSAGDPSERLGLASALAAGGVVAIVVLFWESSGKRQKERLDDERRKALQRTLTRYVGAELRNIALSVNIAGADEAGQPLHRFDNIGDAMRAFESYRPVEVVMRAVSREANERIPSSVLVLNAADSLDRFFSRLATHLDVMLSFFIEVADARVVDALLGLWKEQAAHTTWCRNTTKTGLPPRSLSDLVDNPAQWAGYLGMVAEVLLAYAELLRAIDGVDSGIAGQ